MSEAKIRLVFLWHMHQPYYKELAAGLYRLPWARLHALKDYYGMVAMLEEFPRIHQTFNLVPSLLLQLEEYAAGTARETVEEIAFQPASELSREDQLFILQYFFQANVDHLISRYPRYRQLYDRMQANDSIAERALPFFQESDFADLQVLSQLAWFDEIVLAGDPEIRALVSEGRGYGRADQLLLQKKQKEVIRNVIQAYRTAAERGQIEISTSPFYHPILPLLCDTHIATEAHPGARLPQRRFRRPEDARLQLERAVELHQRLFGRFPSGVWPSEGSVSEQVLEIGASLQFRWIASDQKVLGNSIGISFFRDPSGVLVNADRLYTPYRFSTPAGPIGVLFRDQELSDRIGFVYARVPPEAAAADLLRRIKQSALPLVQQGKNVVVSIILDGENAWEYYPQNGRPFLRSLYRLLSDDPQVECCTVSEALERHGAAEPLPRLAPGSWINANFDIWIGAEEDNLAWDFLSKARDFFAEHEKAASPENRALALEELLIAEGSDWCWWYGPEHSTANDPEFDALYRSHLANVYRALGHRPPEALAQPIARFRPRVLSTPPEVELSPRIDGAVTTYFEWMGAGLYSPVRRAATMHGPPALLRELHFGRDSGNFYLRVDFQNHAREVAARVKLRVAFRQAACPAVLVTFSRSAPGQAVVCEIHAEQEQTGPALLWGQAALGDIFEMRLSLGAMGVGSADPFGFQVSVWENDLPRDTLPLEGWLEVPVCG